MSGEIAEAFVKISPNTEDLDRKAAKLRDLLRLIADALDEYLADDEGERVAA